MRMLIYVANDEYFMRCMLELVYAIAQRLRAPQAKSNFVLLWASSRSRIKFCSCVVVEKVSIHVCFLCTSLSLRAADGLECFGVTSIPKDETSTRS
jgi:hypothetical protein